MKRFAALTLLLLIAVVARAQNSPAPSSAGNITAAATNCFTTNACVVLQLANSNVGYSVVISGTFSATLQIEESVDGVNWTSVSSLTTATQFNSTLKAGLVAVRVRCSVFTSGTAVVTITAGGSTTIQNNIGGSGGVGQLTKTASSLGAALNTNLQTGGGTDDTTVLQNYLMPSGSCPAVPVVLIMDGPALIHGLNICSNTTIQGSTGSLPAVTVTGGPGFYLKTASNTWMIANSNPSGSSITASNIVIQGLFLNGNSGGTGRPNNSLQQANNSYNPCIQLWGTSNVTIYNVSTLNCAFTGYSFSGQNLTTQNTRYEYSPNTNLNTGGSDIRGNTVAGGTANVRIINETVCAGDDAVAFNTRNYGSAIVGPFLVGGTIQHVTVDGLYGDCTASPWLWSGVDLISSGFLMDDVSILHVRGNVANFCVYVQRDRSNAPPDNGQFGEILVDDADCNLMGPPFGGNIDTGLFPVDSPVSVLRLHNIRGVGVLDPQIINPASVASIGQLITDSFTTSVVQGTLVTPVTPSLPVDTFQYFQGPLPTPYISYLGNCAATCAVNMSQVNNSHQFQCTNCPAGGQIGAVMYGNVPLISGNQFSEVQAATTGSDANSAIYALFRIQVPVTNPSSTSNKFSHYQCQVFNGNIVLQKWNADVVSNLGTVAQAITAGDKIRGWAVGSNLYCSYNGAIVIGPVVDATFSGGTVGLAAFNATGGAHSFVNRWTAGYLLADQRPIVIANQGRNLINGDVTVGTGWGTSASAAVCSTPGFVQDFCFTITSGSASFTAAPTVTVNLPVPIPSTATRCHLSIIGITGAGGAIMWSLTTPSTTAPVFTAVTSTGAAFTPAASETYTMEGGCGP